MGVIRRAVASGAKAGAKAAAKASAKAKAPKKPTVWKTPDGYTFYELPNGEVVDNLNPDSVDMSWPSVREFIDDMEGTAFKEGDELGQRRSTIESYGRPDPENIPESTARTFDPNDPQAAFQRALNQQRLEQELRSSMSVIPGGKASEEKKPAGKMSSISPEEFRAMVEKGMIRSARGENQELRDLMEGRSKFAELSLNWDLPETYDLEEKLKAQGFKVKTHQQGPSLKTYVFTNEKDLEPLFKAKTPAGFGKAYGYSDEDIARFYWERGLGRKQFAEDMAEVEASKAKPGDDLESEFREYGIGGSVLSATKAGAKAGAKAAAKTAAKAKSEAVKEAPAVIKKRAKPGQTVSDPERMAFPGIYKRPDVIAKEAASMVAPESPSMKQLFGVTREELYDLSKGMKGNLPGDLPGAAAKPKGSEAAEKVMTPRNTQRILDVLYEVEKFPELVQGMDAWYRLEPLYERMVQVLGPDRAATEFPIVNALMGMASPGSEVTTEIPRGTAAYYLHKQGRFPEFMEHLGKPVSLRSQGLDPEILGVPGHPYHKTAQGLPMQRFLESGEVQMESPKVPMYIQASGTPETGFQTRTPVGDAHWSRAAGLADVRKSKAFGASVSTPEMSQLAPWWREKIAGEVGIESVPAQARAWGAFSPQTGVTTPIGAPKLELISEAIMDAAARLGVSPEMARDMWIRGEIRLGGNVGMAEGGSVEDISEAELDDLIRNMDLDDLEQFSAKQRYPGQTRPLPSDENLELNKERQDEALREKMRWLVKNIQQPINPLMQILRNTLQQRGVRPGTIENAFGYQSENVFDPSKMGGFAEGGGVDGQTWKEYEEVLKDIEKMKRADIFDPEVMFPNRYPGQTKALPSDLAMETNQSDQNTRIIENIKNFVRNLPQPMSPLLQALRNTLQSRGVQPGVLEEVFGQKPGKIFEPRQMEEFADGGSVGSPDSLPKIVSDLEMEFQQYQVGGAVARAVKAGAKAGAKASKGLGEKAADIKLSDDLRSRLAEKMKGYADGGPVSNWKDRLASKLQEMGFAAGGAVKMAEGGDLPQDELSYMAEALSPERESEDSETAKKIRAAIKAGKVIATSLPKALVSPVVGLYGTAKSGKYGTREGVMAGEKAMEEFMEPSEETVKELEADPLAMGYLENVGKFMEELETKYKLPPLMPELYGVATGTRGIVPQVKNLAKKGAAKAKEAVSEVPTLPVGLSMEPVGKPVSQVISETKPGKIKVEANEAGFYSPIEKAVVNLQRKQGPGQAFLSDIMKFNPSKGELEATGIADWLKDQKSVTKQEVMDYINGNKVELVETVRGTVLSDADRQKFNDINRRISRGFKEMITPEEEEFFEATRAKLAEFKEPRFERENLILPGGANYREILLKLPVQEKKYAYEVFDPATQKATKFDTYDEALKFANQKGSSQSVLAKVEVGEDKTYNSSHWPDDPNTLAHMRVQDMKINGKKTLMIEEIQSDWHQTGRERGYAGELPKDWSVEQDDLLGWVVRNQDGEAIGSGATKQEALRASETGSFGRVPDAPFKKDWYQLAIKRLFKYAADNDYDQIALVGPEEQIRRGSLGTHIDGLFYEKASDGSIKLEAEKNGKVVLDKTVKPDDLELYVGKDVAKRIIQSEEKDGTLFGDDLKIGGEGMRQYYDRSYPDSMNKIGKKYGAKLEKRAMTINEYGPDDVETVQTGEADRFGREVIAYKVVDPETDKVIAYEYDFDKALREANKSVPQTSYWLMDLSPDMKKDVKIGQPFKKGGAVKMRRGGPIVSTYDTIPDITDAGQIKLAALEQELRNYA